VAYLEVSEGKSIYFEHYAGQGRPVVLSHGWGMSCRAWDTLLPVLVTQGHEVVTYDHRGCGSSDKDFADVSIDALGSDVVALVDHLSLQAPVLNGWSLGGPVVVDAASKLGDRLGGLVSTVGATPRYTQAEGWDHGGDIAAVEGTVAALQADRATFLHGLYHQGVFHAAVSDQVKDWLVGLAYQASPAADASLGALAVLDQRDAMAAIAAPALVVVGANDLVVDPNIGRAAAELLPAGRLLELAGSGHAPFLEEPDAYQGALLEFLAELG
jgi:non-heme chloroperoxidase